MHEFNVNTYRAYWIDHLAFWERTRIKQTRAERIATPEYERIALRSSRANVRRNAQIKVSFPAAWLRGW